MTTPHAPNARPRFLVCEDGREYLERFERFLGVQYEFVQSRCASELLTQLNLGTPAAGVLLDLDFRRTELALLIDGNGKPLTDASSEERKRLVANQGIAILACVRQHHTRVPVFLFADLAETQQTFLEQRFAPLTIVPSHMSMRQLQGTLQRLAPHPPES